jgi:hypothetical protein
LLSVVALVALGGITAPGLASANPTVYGSWQVGDRGPGGWAGGALFQDGSADGSGEIAGPGAIGHIQAERWASDPSAGFDDVEVVFDFNGAGPVPACLRIPESTRAKSAAVAIYVGGNCQTGSPTGTTYGKVTVTG